jgi:predicted regulator of Ras-like GTPase activity (Roadblock/LC7/MglB family)
MQSANLSQVLEGLRDLEGVYGSFVLTRSGELLGKDLPNVFDEALFAEVGPRIARLTDTLIDQEDKLSTMSVSAGNYKLHLRDLPDGMLGVLMSMHANMPALNMAINVAVRRLPAMRQEVPVPPPEVPTVPHHAIPSPHPLPPAGAVPYPTERKTVPPPFRAHAPNSSGSRSSPGINVASNGEVTAEAAASRYEDNTAQTPSHSNVFHDVTPKSSRPVMFRGRKLSES